MAIAQVNTGTSSILFLEGYEVGYDVFSNTRTITWSLYLRENGGSNSAWNGGGVSAFIDASVNGAYQGNLWEGSFGFDFRGGGYQTQVIAEGSTVFGSNPDGTGSVNIAGHIGYTGSSTAGGPTDVHLSIPVTTLKRMPNVPGSVSAVRNSDTQVTVSWANSGASNGQPTQNRVQKSVNGGAWTDVVTISAAGSTTVAVAANQKVQFRVAAGNAAGWTAYSGATAAVFTTPAAPTNVTATKGANLDITVKFAENVNYSEYNHEVWHGVVAGGVTTWDASALATLGTGVLTYTHVAPNPSNVHVYRVRAKQGALLSGYAQSNSVQLLVAPNKPTIAAMPAVINRAEPFVISWNHNSVDTSPQSAYQMSYSYGSGPWLEDSKFVSTDSSVTFAPDSFASNAVLSIRARTWGQATTGGSDGTGASPWSDPATVTFKTVPNVTITAPANGSNLSDSTIRATLAFSQPEGAKFVMAQLELLQAGTLVETLESNVLVGIEFDTPALNGQTYTVRARVLDSNGLWSAWKSNTVSITYLPPVAAAVTTDYIEEQGFGQISLRIPAPGAGQVAAATVTITRTIDNVTETIVKDYPVTPEMGFLDTTPTIHGTNRYTVTTVSAQGSQTSVSATLVTEECRRAFLSKGAALDNVVSFGGNLQIDESVSVASSTIQAAGRAKPVGLYGMETSVQLKVKSLIFEGFGSDMKAIRNLLLVPGRACYRDPSGRRIFGAVKGSVSMTRTTRGDLNFTITETS